MSKVSTKWVPKQLTEDQKVSRVTIAKEHLGHFNHDDNFETRGPRWPCIAHLITRQVSSQQAFLFKRRIKFKIDFQDDCNLGFPIRMILATVDLQVTSKLPIGFESNGLFGSG